MSQQLDTDTLPKYLRVVMAFIDRIGFPILAFLIVSYLCFSTLEGVKVALIGNTQVLRELKTIICVKAGTVMENK